MKSITLVGPGPSNQNYYQDEPVAVITRAGETYQGEIKYWFSLHPENFEEHLMARKLNKLDCQYITFIAKKSHYPCVDCMDSDAHGGSSSLYALDCLIKMGYNHVHLVGVDLTDGYSGFRLWWEEYNPKIKVTTAGTGWIKDWCERKSK